jgi:hypothetical protein
MHARYRGKYICTSNEIAVKTYILSRNYCKKIIAGGTHVVVKGHLIVCGEQQHAACMHLCGRWERAGGSDACTHVHEHASKLELQ